MKSESQNNSLKPSSLKIFLNLIVIILAILTGYIAFNYYQDDLEKKRISRLNDEGKNLFDQQSYSLALSKFSERLKYYPNDTEALRMFAKINYLKGRYKTSIEAYEKISWNNLSDLEVQDLGDAYLKTQNFDSVIKLWDGRKITPQNTFRLAELYKSRNEKTKYLELLQDIHEYQEALIRLITVDLNALDLTRLNQIKSAEKIIDSSDFELFFLQIEDVLAQRKLGKIEYSNLLLYSSYANINECFLIKDNIDDLRLSFQKKQFPEFQIDFLEGKCKSQNQEYADANILIEKAIKAEPTNVEYREELAYLYYLQSDFDKFEETYKNIFKINKTVQNQLNYADLLLNMKKFDESIQIYESILTNKELTVNIKSEVAKKIIEINLFKYGNLDICKRNDLIDSLLVQSKKDELMKSACLLKLGNEPKAEDQLINEFLIAVSTNNKSQIIKVLDKDIDGIITDFYEKIYKKLS